MNKIIALAEQHVRESASHLRHIDEMMARARSAPSSKKAAAEELLRRIEDDRNRLARDLEAFKSLSGDDEPAIVQKGEGLTGMLKALGLQLEQVLVGIFDQGK